MFPHTSEEIERRLALAAALFAFLCGVLNLRPSAFIGG
jgi:hypothetical protein